MTPNSTDNYTSDRPISSKDEDAFQRFEFSKRIAETIIARKQEDSLVLGVFGAWGEGKSTVLNFINQELKNGNDILTITFNPWRYGDEDSLIRSFLRKIASLLGKELKSKKEKVGGFINEHGSGTVSSIFSLLGLEMLNIGESVAKVGKGMSKVDLEDVKNRVDDFLKKAEKKLVIFIDDIDRLDKQEIYTLFRLVKLTADFKNTTYILSFDKDMVADAIGDRFGSGDKKAGENFLEKIIQVPLTIPKAQPTALTKFCLQLIDNVLQSNDIQLSKKEEQQFVQQFTTNIVSRLSTPRLAIRYANTLSFSMPLLKDEVNMVDLMLIEALRAFYPNYYNFVKNNPDYFIGSYSRSYSLDGDSKSNSIKNYFNEFEGKLQEKDKHKAQDLLHYLFPNLAKAFRNHKYYNSSGDDKLYLNKRIGAPKYFERYFSYAVIEGDISDVEFQLFLNKIAETEDTDEIIAATSNLFKGGTDDNVLYKLRSQEREYSWDLVKKIAKGVCDISENLSNKKEIFTRSTFTNAAIFIYQMIKHHKDENDVFGFAKELLNYSKYFNFAYTVNEQLCLKDSNGNTLFSDKELEALWKIIIERAVEESKNDSIFDYFPEYIRSLARAWRIINKPEFEEYVGNYLNEKERNVILLIESYVPIISSSAKPEPYKGDFEQNQYQVVVSLYNKEDLYNRILKVYSLEEVEREEPFWINLGLENDYTELNMVRQFMKWYKEEQAVVKEEEE